MSAVGQQSSAVATRSFALGESGRVEKHEAAAPERTLHSKRSKVDRQAHTRQANTAVFVTASPSAKGNDDQAIAVQGMRLVITDQGRTIVEVTHGLRSSVVEENRNFSGRSVVVTVTTSAERARVLEQLMRGEDIELDGQKVAAAGFVTGIAVTGPTGTGAKRIVEQIEAVEAITHPVTLVGMANDYGTITDTRSTRKTKTIGRTESPAVRKTTAVHPNELNNLPTPEFRQLLGFDAVAGSSPYLFNRLLIEAPASGLPVRLTGSTSVSDEAEAAKAMEHRLVEVPELAYGPSSRLETMPVHFDKLDAKLQADYKALGVAGMSALGLNMTSREVDRVLDSSGLSFAHDDGSIGRSFSYDDIGGGNHTDANLA